jgi:hypothetical protein
VAQEEGAEAGVRSGVGRVKPAGEAGVFGGADRGRDARRREEFAGRLGGRDLRLALGLCRDRPFRAANAPRGRLRRRRRFFG